MAKCDHSQKIILSPGEPIYLRCILCGEVISVDEIIKENNEVTSWIREIENKNDELTKENVALKNCLKAVIK